MLKESIVATMVDPIAAVKGRFGAYGGRYVPETLMAALEELEQAYEEADADAGFHAELDELLHHYCGRPTPLYFAKRLSEQLGGAKIYLKREDLLHTGAHKINNALGQGLLARRMGKQRIIAETGAGQHGVATATVCALLGLDCVIYMGEEDMRRQELNVYRMRLLGAEVRGVSAGSATLKDAINEAMRDWVTNVRTTYYILGSALGAHPYPTMVRNFHRVISLEARRSFWSERASCRMWWWPVWAAGQMPLGRSTNSCRMTRCGWSAWKPVVAGRRWASTRHASRKRRRAARGAAGNLQLCAAGRCGAGERDALGERGAGLRERGAGACDAARLGACGVRLLFR